MKRQMIDQDQTQQLSPVDVILTLSGMVAPIVLFLAILIVGILRPEYSHISQAISELGARDTPFNKVLNYAGLMPAGILTLAFSLAMFRRLKREFLLNLSSSFVAVVGITRFLAGIFPCDPGCFPIITITGRLHTVSGLTSLFAGTLAPLVMMLGLRHQNLKALYYLSMFLGSASLVLFIMLVSQLFVPFLGAIQRLLLFLTYSWIIAVAVSIKNFAD